FDVIDPSLARLPTGDDCAHRFVQVFCRPLTPWYRETHFVGAQPDRFRDPATHRLPQDILVPLSAQLPFRIESEHQRHEAVIEKWKRDLNRMCNRIAVLDSEIQR